MTDDYDGRFGDDPASDRDGALLDVELGGLLTRITHDPARVWWTTARGARRD